MGTCARHGTQLARRQRNAAPGAEGVLKGSDTGVDELRRGESLNKMTEEQRQHLSPEVAAQFLADYVPVVTVMT